MKNNKKVISNLEVEKIVFKGLGLAYHQDKAVFIRHAIPGDIVDAKILNAKKNSLLAKPIKYCKKSLFREKSNCEVFGKCGGCDWLDVMYSRQLQLKRDYLIDMFKDALPEEKILPVVASPQKDYYRNKVFQPVHKVDGKIRLGMFERQSHRVISHSSCFLHPPIYDKIFATLKDYLYKSKAKIYNEKRHTGNVRYVGIRSNFDASEFVVVLVTKNRKLAFTHQLIKRLTKDFSNIVGIIQNINPDRKNRILGDDEKLLYGRRYLNDRLDNVRYQLAYDSFYQINSSLTEKLYAEIKSMVTSEKVIDAYCGAGTIALYIARKVERVIGIESNASSINNAQKNAEINNISNCRFINDTVENQFEKIDLSQFQTIIFDPPRKGIDKLILQKTVESSIKKIIYVSCNPSTQKRDMKVLLENGFSIEKMKPFDMFPHTWHVENLVLLSR